MAALSHEYGKRHCINSFDFSIQIRIFASEKKIDMENLKEKTYMHLRRDQERYKEQYSRIEDECARAGLSFEEFVAKTKDIKERLYFIDKYIKLKMDPVVEYGKEWKGTKYELDDFKNMVYNGELSDDDGYGYYATMDSKSDIVILPSDVLENITREDFTHVIWFPKSE